MHKLICAVVRSSGLCLRNTIVWTILIDRHVELLMISLFCGLKLSVESYKNTALQRSAMSIETESGQSRTPAECYVDSKQISY